jgi:hypothetical protein
MTNEVALALVAGVALVKGTMVLLDKSGALKQLPPWVRPWVPVAGAAVAGLLQALLAGVDPMVALLGAGSALGLSEATHSIGTGIKRSRNR